MTKNPPESHQDGDAATVAESAAVVESADYDVSVTIIFSTHVDFAEMERHSPITNEDALANFYGYGLSEVLDSGEYAYSVSDITIKRVES